MYNYIKVTIIYINTVATGYLIRGGSKGGHRGHVPPRQSAQPRDRASGGLLVNVRHGMAVDGRELKEGYHAWLA